MFVCVYSGFISAVVTRAWQTRITTNLFCCSQSLFYPLVLAQDPSFSLSSPPFLSICVNQYSLLTHDSPHMSSTAQGLR